MYEEQRNNLKHPSKYTKKKTNKQKERKK